MTEETFTGKLRRPPANDGTPPTPRVFIATPCFNGVCTAEYALGLNNLVLSLERSGIATEIGLLSKESLITRARNKLVADFRKSTCTHLFFVDADIGFTAADFKPLAESGFDVVCGAYPMKRVGWKNVTEAVREGKAPEQLAKAGACYAVNAPSAAQNGATVKGVVRAGARFLEVLDAATGFLLITRAAIEKYIAHYGKSIEFTADYEPNIGEIHHRVFDAGEDPSCPRQEALEALALAAGLNDSGKLAIAAELYRKSLESQPGRYLSEDYWFSRKWQRMGGQVWLCLAPKLSHTGPYTYTGDIATLFEDTPAPSPEPNGQAVQQDASP